MNLLVAIPLGLFMLSAAMLIRDGLREIADAIRDVNNCEENNANVLPGN